MNSYQDEEQQEKQSDLAPSSHVLATAQSKQKQQQTLTFSYHPNEAQKSGRPNTLTKQEKKDFNQFKEMLDPTDIVQSTMPHEKEKNMLLRYLRADKFDIPKAKQRWDNMVTWKKEHHVIERMTSMNATEMVFGQRLTLSNIVQKYPYGVIGTDRQGRPLVFKRVGNLNTSIFKDMTVEEIILWEAMCVTKTMHYWMPRCSVVSGHHVENIVSIIDLDGMGFTSFDSNMRGVIMGGMKLIGDHFPETLGAMFILNAPFSFRGVWSIISSFLDPVTVAKVRMSSSSSHPDLTMLVDKDMLPIEYGGTGKLGLGSLDDLHVPETCWILENGRPESWGPNPFVVRRTTTVRDGDKPGEKEKKGEIEEIEKKGEKGEKGEKGGGEHDVFAIGTSVVDNASSIDSASINPASQVKGEKKMYEKNDVSSSSEPSSELSSELNMKERKIIVEVAKVSGTNRKNEETFEEEEDSKEEEEDFVGNVSTVSMVWNLVSKDVTKDKKLTRSMHSSSSTNSSRESCVGGCPTQ